MNQLVPKLISLFIDSVILMYIDFVNKASPKCADIMETDILRNLTFISAGISLLNIISEDKLRSVLSSNQILVAILSFLGIAKLIILFRFVNAMKTEECNESTYHWRRRFLFYYSRGILLLFSLMVIYLVYSLMSISKK
jgi:hypothetical protein